MIVILFGYCAQYHPSNIVEYDYITYVEYDYITVRYVFFVDMYSTPRTCDCHVSCRWKGMPCSHEDFQETVTDAGVCYTFNARNNANSTINATGK